MQYFKPGMTVEAIKKHYRDLARRYHPDFNPATSAECNEIMIAVNNEYETAIKAAYRAESKDKYSAKVEASHLDIAGIIDDIINLPGIDIEICGTWIWIGGDTKPVKDSLAVAGFRWSSNKKKWYKAAEGFGKRRRGYYDMDRIRFMHGSTQVKSAESLKLN